MPVNKARATWEGALKDGKGRIEFGGGRFNEPYNAKSRFEEGNQTNPEELIAAAHAACFSMALSNLLADAGHAPKQIETEAQVRLEKQADGFAITRVDLATVAEAPGIEEDAFKKHAEDAKLNCPVSKALGGTEIRLKARLR